MKKQLLVLSVLAVLSGSLVNASGNNVKSVVIVQTNVGGHLKPVKRTISTVMNGNSLYRNSAGKPVYVIKFGGKWYEIVENQTLFDTGYVTGLVDNYGSAMVTRAKENKWKWELVTTTRGKVRPYTDTDYNRELETYLKSQFAGNWASYE